MNLRHILPLAALALVGCGRVSQDASRVLANVGGAKITEQDLAGTVKLLARDASQAESVLKDPARRMERQSVLEQMAQTQAILELGRQEGLDQDPKVQARLEQAKAQVYMQALAERRVTKQEPTEADLKALYDGFASQAKAAGQAMPPYDQALPRLKEIWSQKQQQQLMAGFQQEITSRVHITFADETGVR